MKATSFGRGFFMKKLIQYPLISIIALLSALNYAIFVFPNGFAPAGIDGICTMIQDATGISIGYFSLLVNVPLLILAFIFLEKEFALKTSVYVVSFSVFNIFIKNLDLSAFTYQSGTMLAPVAAGTVRGILYFLTLKLEATSGGTDIVAALVRKKIPYLNLMNVIFMINMGVALISYPVYGFKMDPVICSIIYSFVTSTISNNIRAGESKMVKYEIICDDAESLVNSIFANIHRTATVMEAQGAYSHKNKKMIVCVVESKKTYELERLIASTKNTVFIKSLVNDIV